MSRDICPLCGEFPHLSLRHPDLDFTSLDHWLGGLGIEIDGNADGNPEQDPSRHLTSVSWPARRGHGLEWQRRDRLQRWGLPCTTSGTIASW